MGKEQDEARYCEKLEVICQYVKETVDPSKLSEEKWIDDINLLPEVEFGQMYAYLIDTPGQYTREKLRAYKSLDAFNYYISGWVQTVWFAELGLNCVMKADVKASQRLSCEPHKAWIESSRAIDICFFNPNKKKERCERLIDQYEQSKEKRRRSSSPVPQLKKADVFNRLYNFYPQAAIFKVVPNPQKSSRYSTSNTPPNPTPSSSSMARSVPPGPSTSNSLPNPTPSSSSMARSVPPGPSSNIPPNPTLSSSSSVLRLVPGPVPSTFTYSNARATSSNMHELLLPVFCTEDADDDNTSCDSTPSLLLDLYNVKYKELSAGDLSKQVREVFNNLKVLKPEVKFLEKATRNQSSSLTWFTHRKGCITASHFNDIGKSQPSKRYPKSIVKAVMQYNTGSTSNVPAIKWGREKEDVA